MGCPIRPGAGGGKGVTGTTRAEPGDWAGIRAGAGFAPGRGLRRVGVRQPGGGRDPNLNSDHLGPCANLEIIYLCR